MPPEIGGARSCQRMLAFLFPHLYSARRPSRGISVSHFLVQFSWLLVRFRIISFASWFTISQLEFFKYPHCLSDITQPTSVRATCSGLRCLRDGDNTSRRCAPNSESALSPSPVQRHGTLYICWFAHCFRHDWFKNIETYLLKSAFDITRKFY